jgi:hypothetical protein
MINPSLPIPVPSKDRAPRDEDCNEKGECWHWDVSSDSWTLYKASWLHDPDIYEVSPYWLPFKSLPCPF